MPRSSSDKPNPGGSKPYPKPVSITKTQADHMARALAGAVLSAFNIEADAEEPRQTTHSEDEEEMEEEAPDQSNPTTMSSSSSYDALQVTLAPLRQKLANAEAMLEKLRPYMRTFVESKNQRGLEETAALTVEYEAIFTDAKSQIAEITKEWEELERAKREEEKEAKRRVEASKAKGKEKAPREEEDEQLARLAELARVPGGNLFTSLTASKRDPIFAALDAIRDGPQPSTPIKPQSHSAITSRFPNDRVLPSGFHMSHGHSHVATSPKLSAFPSTSTNPFGATPLQAPEDFSPSKVVGTKVAAPKTVTESKKPRAKVGKGGGSVVRASTRPKKDVTYVESAEDGSDALED